jgi:type I restriction enzyme S subunit
MTEETFFEKFDQFADAPDAVAKMRELVLDLAIQGRLVSQNAEEETAHSLLGRVASTAKTRGRVSSESVEPNAAFPIPSTWAWVRLPRVLTKLTDGTHHSPPNGPSGDFMYVTAKNIKTDGVLLHGITYVSKKVHDEIYSRCDPSFGDVLYIKDGATTGIATINQVKEPFSMLSSVALLKPSEAIFNRYLLWAMRSPFFYAETRGAMKGAAITRVTLSVMAASLLPLPPLAEQKRIVAKVDELMALCDRLEAQQQERQTRHSALARASLARFADAPTPANLPFLFHPSYAIPPADLRKSILTLAVQGKLLSRIESEGMGSDILKEAGVSEEPPDDVPELPNYWVWARLGSIAKRMDSGWSPACIPEPAAKGEWGVLKTTAVQTLQYLEVQNKALPPNLEPRPEHEVMDSDILFTRAGPMNRVGILCVARPTRKKLMISDKIIRFHLVAGIDPDFAALSMNAGHSSTVIEGLKSGMAASQVNISQPKLRSVPIPLPPLAEQRRIVAKVEQLMALVDALETQLAASRATAANLLSALVAELTGTPNNGKVSVPATSTTGRRGRPRKSA